MKKKEITFRGKQYPVVFNMQTIMNFEDITNVSFFQLANFNNLKYQIALIFAAYIATLGEDEEPELKFSDFAKIDQFEEMMEVVKASNVVMELMNEMFHMPKVIKPETEKKDDEDQEKNV